MVPSGLEDLPWELPHGFLGLSGPSASPEGSGTWILPVPYEATTSWGQGTRNGPRAILWASRFIELYDHELDTDPSLGGVYTLPALELPRGEARAAMELLEEAYGRVLQAAEGRRLIMLGGEHSVSAPAITQCVIQQDEDSPEERLSVLQFDAHLDLRESWDGSAYSHACALAHVVDRVDLVTVGARGISGEEKAAARARDSVRVITAEEVARDGDWMDRVLDGLGPDGVRDVRRRLFRSRAGPVDRDAGARRRVLVPNPLLTAKGIPGARCHGCGRGGTCAHSWFTRPGLRRGQAGVQDDGLLDGSGSRVKAGPPTDAPARDPEAPAAGSHFPVAALSRATSSRLIGGNRIALQFDGAATFETWLEAIAGASRTILFENYVMRDDATGRRFQEALAARAEAGVHVHVLYDWIGCWATSKRYWRRLEQAGVHVRAFNRPALRDPFRVFQRDHRKLVCVDGTVAYVGGFCVGDEWAGTGDQPPWRDTGIEIRGPAAAAAGRTFERAWRSMGPALPPPARIGKEEPPALGDSSVWVIQGQPWRSRVYRATQLIAASATRNILDHGPLLRGAPTGLGGVGRSRQGRRGRAHPGSGP